MDNPKPSPPNRRVRDASACLNRSKTCGRKSERMPAPLSSTTISTCDPARRNVTFTSPPLGVNLSALDSRFQTTCCRRAGSPAIGPVVVSS